MDVRSRRGAELQKDASAGRTRPPDIARKRRRWKAHQGRIEASRLVFIDETWIKTNMAPLRGWGRAGNVSRRLRLSAIWKTMTFIAALRHDRISAPWVIDGPINGELFTFCVEQALAPRLGTAMVVADGVPRSEISLQP
jgi:hypothetical protein